MSLHETIKSAREELRNLILNDEDSRDPSDIISELADCHVPIYNAERARMLLDDLSLGSEEPEIGSDGTVWGILGAAIYQRISEALHEELSDIEDAQREIEELRGEKEDAESEIEELETEEADLEIEDHERRDEIEEEIQRLRDRMEEIDDEIANLLS